MLWPPSHVCIWTIAFISHTSGPAVLRAHSATAAPPRFSPLPTSSEGLSSSQCLGVFLPSSLTSEWATPSSFFLQLCLSWNLQAHHPTGPCKNESRLPPFRDLKCTMFSGG